MHKFISIILSFVLILSLSACGSTVSLQAGSANARINGTDLEPQNSLAGEIVGEINISTYEAMKYKAFLEDAARLFEKKYPGTTVNVETFVDMPDIKTSGKDGENMILVEYKDDPQSRLDYINKVNTALMSGGGADIFAIDVLPFYKYADNGQLENLADYIQDALKFNKADYRENIIDAVEYKKGIWFLPMDYTFNYYAYDSSLLTGSVASGFGIDGKFTAQELISLSEPFFDGSSMITNRSDYVRGPRGDMWGLLLEENYTSFVDIENKKANFNDGSFAALLESVKQYSKQGYIPEGQASKTDRFFFKPQNVINLISLFTRNLGMKMTGMAEGGTMSVGEDDEIAGIAAGVKGSVPFTYSQAYGINHNSKNKGTAWAFLRLLLSEEMQLNTNLLPTSLPVLNTAREKKMEIALTSLMGQQGESLNEAQLEAIVKYNEAVEKLSDQIDDYYIKDTVIDDMISAEVQYFFEGTKTASEVADVLQNKVDLYMNE